MSFMEEILKDNRPIWDQCAATAFLRQMASGELPPARFRAYLIQDSIYLKNYARVYGKAIYHADTLREIQLYYDILSFVTDRESSVRRRYLEQFGLTDGDIEHIAPLPENQQYLDFLFAIAEGGDSRQILMSLLPCMLSYSYVFQKLAALPESRRSRYWPYIQDYADPLYADSCRAWCAFADQRCAGLPPVQRQALGRVFMRGSCLELDFWNMSCREERP